MGKLNGKTVLVTGASRGIGAEIARLFAAEGGRVICAARTLREGDHPLAGSLESTVAAIRAEGGTAEAVTANISEPAECERLVQTSARDLRPGGRARQQRRADLLRADQGLPGQQVDAVVGGELPRAVHPEPARPRGHDPASDAASSSTSPRAPPSGPGAVPTRTRLRARAAAPATAPRRPRSSASPRDSPRRCTSTASRYHPWRRPRWSRPPAPCTTGSSRPWTIRAESRRSSWPRPRSCSPPSRSTRPRAA